MLGDVLKRKHTILDEKNVDILIVKKWNFPNGVSHGFCQILKSLKLFLFYENKSGEIVKWVLFGKEGKNVDFLTVKF